MTLWTASDAQLATGGRATRDWQASGVSIDTRTLAPGDLFVALKDIRDGHDFVAQALQNGAAAALVSRVPDGVDPDAPLLIVEDVLAGLEALGRAARARAQAKVIGITGSVGKTSTKEMLRIALAGQGVIHAAEKSYNNHWGVPLTLARMPAETEFAIIEIGMNHPGEIAPLARMADLDVALITTVAPAHLEAFASVAEIAREKAAIFEGLREGGVGIYNADLEETPILRQRAGPNGLSFGKDDAAQCQLLEASARDDVTVCRAQIAGQEMLFKLSAPGTHFAMNGLACLAAAQAAGADIGRTIVALSDWQPPAGRGKRQFIGLDAVDLGIGIDLFDDAYNANPASVAAALEVLSAATPPAKAGHRIAILGDMKELGPTSETLHSGIADLPSIEPLDRIHCIGPMMRALYEALPQEKRGLWAETAEELAAFPAKLVTAGDSVMVKGSFSMKMGLIVDAITKLGQATPKKEEEGPL